MRRVAFFTLTYAILISSCMGQNQKTQTEKSEKEVIVLMKTSMGDMKIKLYNETPLHRDNFVKLVKEKFYDGLLFHRVIRDFMIQGGDPDSKDAPAGKMLGMGDPGYTIPAEIFANNSQVENSGMGSIPAGTSPMFTHKKGALAAARTNNPEKRSSGSQFYIVHNDNGTPHLDGEYTVFGEVIEGMEVVDKIATVKTGAADRPVEDVKIISVTIVE